MNQVQVEQKSFSMPPQDGFTVAHFLTVADIERSARFYETVFEGRVLSKGDSSGAPGYIQIANTWLIVNVGGGPTPDKPTVTLSVPPDPDAVSSFMNIRVADIQACYESWKSRGAEFITKPIPKYGEIRCYMRDPDGCRHYSHIDPHRHTATHPLEFLFLQHAKQFRLQFQWNVPDFV